VNALDFAQGMDLEKASWIELMVGRRGPFVVGMVTAALNEASAAKGP